MNKIWIIMLGVLGIFGGVVAGAAISSWNQGISWNIPANTNITVWTAATAGTQSPTTLNLTTPANPTIINYYIQNDGNVPLTVTASITFNTGSATVTWNPTSGIVTVPVGPTRIHLILTLTDFSVGVGSANVAFEAS